MTKKQLRRKYYLNRKLKSNEESERYYKKNKKRIAKYKKQWYLKCKAKNNHSNIQ